MDFCPAFWDWLILRNASDQVYSLEAVGTELGAIDDELSDWAEARGEDFFLPPDQEMVKAFPELSTWANSQNYRPAAITRTCPFCTLEIIMS